MPAAAASTKSYSIHPKPARKGTGKFARRTVLEMPIVLVAAVVTAFALFAGPASGEWRANEIAASHALEIPRTALPAEPRHAADPRRLITIFEAGGWVSILDGDSLQMRGRFQPTFLPEGAPQYSPDGRFLFLHSGDGWIGKYDLFSFKLVAQTRVGEKLRGIALSSDGKWLLAGNARPNTLAVLRARDLGLFKLIDVARADGGVLRVDAVHDAGPRQSFIVGLKDSHEVWELSYDPEAAPVYGNFVHSYRAGQVEGVIVEEQPFARRRLTMAEPLAGFFFDPAYAEVIAQVPGGGAVYNLDARRRVTRLDLGGAPRFHGAVSWSMKDGQVMAVPDAAMAAIDIVDMDSWETLRRIKTAGPIESIISHPGSPFIWAVVMPGSHAPGIHVIDKQSMTIVRSIAPATDGAKLQAAFSRDGRHVLVAPLAKGEVLKIYDAPALREVKRLPMAAPRLR